MKDRKVANILLSCLLIINGLLIIVLPWYNNISNFKIMIEMFMVISVIKLFNYIIDENKNDHEDLYITIMSLVLAGYSMYVGSIKTIENYPLFIIIWVSFYAIIRLIKVDFLHDHSDKKFALYSFCSLLFLIVGILSSFSLYYNDMSSTFILGYFNVIYGILSVGEKYMALVIKGGK